MIQFQSDQGLISVSGAVFTTITGMAATNCFGVKGMAYRSMTDGLVHLLRREAMGIGLLPGAYVGGIGGNAPCAATANKEERALC